MASRHAGKQSRQQTWLRLLVRPRQRRSTRTQPTFSQWRTRGTDGYSCQIVVDEALPGSMKSATPTNPSFSISGSTNLTPRSRRYRFPVWGLNDQAAIYSGTIDNTDRAIGRLVAKLKNLVSSRTPSSSTLPTTAATDRSAMENCAVTSQFEDRVNLEGGHPRRRVEEERRCRRSSSHDSRNPRRSISMVPTSLRYSEVRQIQEASAALLDDEGANMVLRMGDHTLFVSGTAKSPIDFKAAGRLTEQIKQVLGDDLEKVLDGRDARIFATASLISRD